MIQFKIYTKPEMSTKYYDVKISCFGSTKSYETNQHHLNYLGQNMNPENFGWWILLQSISWDLERLCICPQQHRGSYMALFQESRSLSRKGIEEFNKFPEKCPEEYFTIDALPLAYHAMVEMRRFGERSFSSKRKRLTGGRKYEEIVHQSASKFPEVVMNEPNHENFSNEQFLAELDMQNQPGMNQPVPYPVDAPAVLPANYHSVGTPMASDQRDYNNNMLSAAFLSPSKSSNYNMTRNQEILKCRTIASMTGENEF